MDNVTRAPIAIGDLLAEVSGPGLGGTAAFLGTVRAAAEDGPVTAIEYSAYEDMLDAEIARICAEAVTRWAGVAVRLQHRLGTVALGEASIAVAAAAPHRAEAFDACRFVIEEAKRRLPVWKKERMADGTDRWRENDVTPGETAEPTHPDTR